MTSITRGFMFVAALAIGFAGGAVAADGASPWAGVPEAQVRLISADRAAVAGGAEPLLLALEFALQPGWKTYWRNPGDSGAPPQIDWSQSRNIADVTMLWPAPQRFSAFGYDSFGYGGTVVLPLRVAVADAARPVDARANVSFLICAEICLPAVANVNLQLDPGAAGSTPHRARIEQALAQVPVDGPHAQHEFVAATAEAGAERPTLSVQVRARKAFTTPDLMIEARSPFSFGRPEVELSADRRQATLRLPVYGARKASSLSGVPIVLTLVDGAEASEGRLTIGGTPTE